MKKNTLKTILIILIIILLGLVSFGGIYVKNLNGMKNVVKDYNYGMDLNQKLLIGLKVKEDEPEETTTLDNAEEQEGTEQESTEPESTEQVTNTTPEVKVIEKKDVDSVKEILKSRLEAIGIEEFYIRANSSDGSIMIELPNDTKADFLSDLIATGEFKIEDTDGIILGGTEVIEDVSYTLDRTSYSVPCVKIDFKFKHDFVKKLVESKNRYVAITDEEGNSIEKEISLKVDNSSIYSNSAIDMIDIIKLNNTLSLTIGQSDSTEEELQQYYDSAAILATIVKDGKLPLNYQVDTTEIVTSNLTINSIAIIGLIILGLSAIWAIYKYKKQGAIAIISLIGYIAVMLLLIRYTNIVLAFEGIIALALIFGIEYIFILKLVSNFNNKEKSIKIYTKTLIQFLNVIIVSFIIAIVFAIQTWVPIRSFGTVMFWGIIILVAYNYLVTKNLIESTQK